MQIEFLKFHGSGNDFILIDNRKGDLKFLSKAHIKKLCDRRFGIGSDGLIALNKSENADFEMKYYNADGGEGSMCGNGARCVALFAHRLGVFNTDATFVAYDGLHHSKIKRINKDKTLAEIKVSMCDVEKIEKGKDNFFLNTGSPHYVRFVKDVSKVDVVVEGKKIRNSNRFRLKGTNVNFVSIKNKKLFIRTYERGVENETLACGTGITASAIAAHAAGLVKTNTVNVIAMGGSLKVYFIKYNNNYTNIFLQGKAEMVYEGSIIL